MASILFIRPGGICLRASRITFQFGPIQINPIIHKLANRKEPAAPLTCIEFFFLGVSVERVGALAGPLTRRGAPQRRLKHLGDGVKIRLPLGPSPVVAQSEQQEGQKGPQAQAAPPHHRHLDADPTPGSCLFLLTTLLALPVSCSHDGAGENGKSREFRQPVPSELPGSVVFFGGGL